MPDWAYSYPDFSKGVTIIHKSNNRSFLIQVALKKSDILK